MSLPLYDGPMKVTEALARLEELGDEKRRAFNAKRGAGDNQFGVKTGDVRKLAKELKGEHDLGLSLWATGNADAQMLAILLVRPKDLSTEQLSVMARRIARTEAPRAFAERSIVPL